MRANKKFYQSFASVTMVVNNIAALMTAIYPLVPRLVLSKNYKKKQRHQSKVVRDEDYLSNKPTGHGTFNRLFPSSEKKDLVDVQINEFLTKNKCFLEHKYSLVQLARDVNIPRHHLSRFINQYYGIKYNDFINRFRVNEAKELIRRGECEHKTVDAVSSECGFNNRNTFTIAFKKQTGQTPSEFIRKIKEHGFGLVWQSENFAPRTYQNILLCR